MEIEAEREKIQREIEELEKSLGPILPTAEIQGSDFSLESGSEEEEDIEEDDFDIDVNMETDPGGKKDSTSEEEEEEEGEVNLPQTPETCLQMNLVYQEVIQEKIEEVQSLLAQNREQQEKLMWELAGTKGAKAGDGKSLPANMFLGHFMKPYFKDKTSGIGPPANSDAREKARQGIKSFEELLTIKWKSREKLLLRQSVVSDRLHHLLQPKLLKLEYLNEKLEKSKDGMERQIVGKQIRETEQEINVINVLPEEALLGNRLEEHDWDKIANINFEGTRNGKELRKYWQNYEHPSINKKEWEEEEIEKLKEIAASRHFLGWEAIAQELGTQRTAFQCLQKFQSYHKDFKRGEWAPEEDRMLKQLVQEMRIGKHIPYRKIAYYMEGRDPAQLIYRWTKRVDPNLKRGTWTPKEDALLLKAVAKYGERDWYKIRTEVPGRNDIQCRDRYLHSLHYDIKKGRWSEEEERKLVELTEKYGRGHWAKIASELPHRSGAQCLSKWKVLLGYRRNRKKKQGIKLYPKRKRVHRISSNSSESSSENSDLEMDGDSTEEEEEPKSCKSKASGHWRVPSIDLWVPARKQQSEPSSGEMTTITLLSKGFDVNRKRQLVPEEHQSTEDFLTPNSGISESLPMNSRNKDAWRVSLAYVKRVLRSNSYRLQRRNREIRRKKRFAAHSQIVPGDSRLDLAAGEAIRGRGQKDGLWRTTIYRRLMMAVTPWAGSKVQAWALRVKKGTSHESKADITFKQLQTAHLKSTPLFTFLIQLLHIDVDGCMKVIRKRKSQQPELLRTLVGTARKGMASLPSSSQDGKALPGPPVASIQPSKNLIPLRAKEGPVPANTWKARSPPRPASRLKTVSELLREKRLREMKAKKVVPKQILLTPPLLLTPSVVVQQPLAGSPLNPANSQPAPPAASVPLVQAAGRDVASPGEASGDFGEMIFPCTESREASVDMGQGSLLPKGSLGAAGDPTAAPLLPVIDPAQPRPLASLNPANEISRPKSLGAQQNSVHIMPTLVAPLPGIPASLKPALPVTWVLTPQGLIPLTILSLPSQGQPLASGSGASPTPSQPMETLSETPASGVVPLVERPQSQEALPSCSTRADAAAPRLPLVNSRELGGSSSPASAGTLPLNSTVFSRAEPSSAEHQAQVSGGRPSLPPLGGCPEPPLLAQQASPTPPAPQEEPVSPLSRLISLETEAAVKEWARGGSGARVPLLGLGLPYLPPFLCSLKALSVLLSSKKSLERSAAHLVAPPEGQEEPSQPDLEALRQKIRQRLRDNPAYHLLRGRFLAAFTFPAALAALPPSRVTTTLLGGPKGKSSSSEDSCSSEEEEEEEEEAGRETQSRPNGMADAREELEGPGPDSADGSDPTQLRRSSRLRRRRRQL